MNFSVFTDEKNLYIWHGHVFVMFELVSFAFIAFRSFGCLWITGVENAIAEHAE